MGIEAPSPSTESPSGSTHGAGFSTKVVSSTLNAAKSAVSFISSPFLSTRDESDSSGVGLDSSGNAAHSALPFTGTTHQSLVTLHNTKDLYASHALANTPPAMLSKRSSEGLRTVYPPSNGSKACRRPSFGNRAKSTSTSPPEESIFELLHAHAKASASRSSRHSGVHPSTVQAPAFSPKRADNGLNSAATDNTASISDCSTGSPRARRQMAIDCPNVLRAKQESLAFNMHLIPTKVPDRCCCGINFANAEKYRSHLKEGRCLNWGQIKIREPNGNFVCKCGKVCNSVEVLLSHLRAKCCSLWPDEQRMMLPDQDAVNTLEPPSSKSNTYSRIKDIKDFSPRENPQTKLRFSDEVPGAKPLLNFKEFETNSPLTVVDRVKSAPSDKALHSILKKSIAPNISSAGGPLGNKVSEDYERTTDSVTVSTRSEAQPTHSTNERTIPVELSNSTEGNDGQASEKGERHSKKRPAPSKGTQSESKKRKTGQNVSGSADKLKSSHSSAHHEDSDDDEKKKRKGSKRKADSEPKRKKKKKSKAKEEKTKTTSESQGKAKSDQKDRKESKKKRTKPNTVEQSMDSASHTGRPNSLDPQSKKKKRKHAELGNTDQHDASTEATHISKSHKKRQKRKSQEDPKMQPTDNTQENCESTIGTPGKRTDLKTKRAHTKREKVGTQVAEVEAKAEKQVNKSHSPVDRTGAKQEESPYVERFTEELGKADNFRTSTQSERSSVESKLHIEGTSGNQSAPREGEQTGVISNGESKIAGQVLNTTLSSEISHADAHDGKTKNTNMDLDAINVSRTETSDAIVRRRQEKSPLSKNPREIAAEMVHTQVDSPPVSQMPERKSATHQKKPLDRGVEASTNRSQSAPLIAEGVVDNVPYQPGESNTSSTKSTKHLITHSAQVEAVEPKIVEPHAQAVVRREALGRDESEQLARTQSVREKLSKNERAQVERASHCGVSLSEERRQDFSQKGAIMTCTPEEAVHVNVHSVSERVEAGDFSRSSRYALRNQVLQEPVSDPLEKIANKEPNLPLDIGSAPPPACSSASGNKLSRDGSTDQDSTIREQDVALKIELHNQKQAERRAQAKEIAEKALQDKELAESRVRQWKQAAAQSMAKSTVLTYKDRVEAESSTRVVGSTPDNRSAQSYSGRIDSMIAKARKRREAERAKQTKELEVAQKKFQEKKAATKAKVLQKAKKAAAPVETRPEPRRRVSQRRSASATQEPITAVADYNTPSEPSNPSGDVPSKREGWDFSMLVRTSFSEEIRRAVRAVREESRRKDMSDGGSEGNNNSPSESPNPAVSGEAKAPSEVIDETQTLSETPVDEPIENECETMEAPSEGAVAVVDSSISVSPSHHGMPLEDVAKAVQSTETNESELANEVYACIPIPMTKRCPSPVQPIFISDRAITQDSIISRPNVELIHECFDLMSDRLRKVFKNTPNCSGIIDDMSLMREVVISSLDESDQLPAESLPLVCDKIRDTLKVSLLHHLSPARDYVFLKAVPAINQILLSTFEDLRPIVS